MAFFGAFLRPIIESLAIYFVLIKQDVSESGGTSEPRNSSCAVLGEQTNVKAPSLDEDCVKFVVKGGK